MSNAAPQSALDSQIDQTLHQAWRLATLKRGFCAPNPAVGAVVWRPVDEGVQVLGEGYHVGPGHDHAEVMALKQAGEAAHGAYISVTLEPCSHWGRTPPCVEAILRSGLKAVYFAYADPNPAVQAQDGLGKLRDAGVTVQHVPSPLIDRFYRSYAHWHRTQQPWVTTKLAVSADGKVAGPQGQPITITGPEAQCYTHVRRYAADVILTSVQTILADDPALDVRASVVSSVGGCGDDGARPQDPDLDDFKADALRLPVLAQASLGKPLAVVDTHARLPLTAQCLAKAVSVTLYHGPDAPADRLAALGEAGVHCVALPEQAGVVDAHPGLDLVALINHLSGCAHDVWVESGPTLIHALLASGVVQTHLQYTGVRALGEDAMPGLQASELDRSLSQVQAWPLGPDQCQVWELR